VPDARTLAHYAREAPAYLARYGAVTPARPQQLARAFFAPGGRVIDLGCGGGRDLEWLRGAGYAVEGVEPVEAFAAACEGRAGLAGVPVYRDALPELPALRARPALAGAFDGALLSAVLMHLPRWEVPRALESALWLLRPGGRALVSVRAAGEGEGEGEREGERLFTPLTLSELRLLCEVAGGRVLLWEETLEAPAVSAGLGRAGRQVRWRTVVVERPRPGEGDGLARVQAILLHDRKTSSYKFALLRALCDLARERPFCGVYDERAPRLWVPLRAVAALWAQYYWPLGATRQIHGARALGVFAVFERHLGSLWAGGGAGRAGVARLRALLAGEEGAERDDAPPDSPPNSPPDSPPGLPLALSPESPLRLPPKSGFDLSKYATAPSPGAPHPPPPHVAQALTELARLILKGPVSFTRDEEGAPVFTFSPLPPPPPPSGAEGAARGGGAGGGAGAGGRAEEWSLGALSVPSDLWADLRRYWHWVEDSLVARWARFSHALDPAVSAHALYALLDSTRLSAEEAERARCTAAVRALLSRPDSAPALRRCVWTGAPLPLAELDVDHVLPFSLRRQNELWNLLPAAARLNRAKGDAVPTPEVLRGARERILAVWALYAKVQGARLARELWLGLQVSLEEATPDAALALAFERLCLLASALLSSQQARPWRGAGVEGRSAREREKI